MQEAIRVISNAHLFFVQSLPYAGPALIGYPDQVQMVSSQVRR